MNNEHPKSLLKKDTDKPKKKRSVVWDTKTLQEQAIERQLHPVTMKIDEPKTPYTEYQGDDEYLKKITKINQTDYSDDLMDKVLSKINEKKLDDQNQYLEVEVYDKDGKSKKELVKNNHVNSNEFLQKRHVAYANEFTEAKNKFNKDEVDDIDQQYEEQVINNTLFNKFAGRMNDK